MEMSPDMKRLLAEILEVYDLIWKDRTDCLTPARTIAAHLLMDSDLEGEAYYDKEDELTERIEEILKDKEDQ